MIDDRLGRPLRDLRVSVTDRCNFRCPYCMPAEIFDDGFPYLAREQILTFEEITRLVRIAVGLGVDKVRLTGGEPLLRRELPVLIKMLAAIDGIDDLALTTNGTLLPDVADDLAAAGLHRVTVSLDSLDPDVFARMSGNRGDLDQVLAGIEAAEAAGLTPLKINCVVRRGVNEGAVLDLARRFHGTGITVRFIEFMDVGTVAWDRSEVVPADEILATIDDELPLEPVPDDRPGQVATRYRYTDGGGHVGVIASVTAPFCGDCTRARLTAEGKLVTCLFATDGTDLRTPLRDGATDDELAALMGGRWARRTDRYSEERSEAALTGAARVGDKLPMYQLGG